MKKKNKTQKTPTLPTLSSVVSAEINPDSTLTIKTNTTQIIRVLKVSGIDIFNYSDDDKAMVYHNFSTATKAMKFPCKFIFTTTEPDLSEQLSFISYKENKVAHPFHKASLQLEHKTAEHIQNNHRDRLTYMFVYAPPEEKDNLIKACSRFINNMSDLSISVCNREEIIKILAKMATFDVADNINTQSDNVNASIFSQPLKLYESYLEVGKRLATSYIVNNYPSSLPSLALANFCSALSKNTLITLDVSYPNQNDILNDIKNSLKELASRGDIKLDYSDQIDAAAELANIEQLYTDISQGSEQVVSTTFRVYCYGETKKDLEDTYSDISTYLTNFGISGYTPGNEMLDEYTNLFRSADVVGNPMPCEQTYSMQYPFYYQSHIDPQGVFLGFTETGGIAIPDFFRKTPSRTSFDMLLLGVKGSGKTITLLNLMKKNLIRGHKVMAIDIEGQLGAYSQVMGGQTIRLSRQSTINPLEMRQSMVSALEDDMSSIYISELSRIVTFFYQYVPTLNEVEAELFKDILVQTYDRYGINEDTNISNLRPRDYPTFKDVLVTLREQLYAADGSFHNTLTERKIENYERLEIYLKQLSEGIYASMFCGESNVRISDANLIVFDVKALSEMDERIFDAQLFNILSLMWSETCANVPYNNNLDNPNDRRYVISVIDEAHRFIQNNQVAAFIEKLLRRSRKYDAALWFASQSPHEFARADSNSVNAIFSLIQYKVLLKQSSETKPLLRQMFPFFTDSELEGTSSYRAGEMLISIDARQKLHCLLETSDAELMFMGTSRDRESISIQALYSMYPDLTQEQALFTLNNDYNYFISTFSAELIEYLGYTKENSPELYAICVDATKLLARAILSGGVSLAK